MKLLILDDDPQYAKLLSQVCEVQGIDAYCLRKPAQLFEGEISEATVLVLDLIMPEMDGIEVIRALAQNNIYISLILISGFDTRVLHSAQQFAEAHSFKVLGSLTKPIDMSEFGTMLNVLNEKNDWSEVAIKGIKEYKANEIADAILSRQFVPYFQPQIDLKNKRVYGAEVLIRWRHPEDGIVPPGMFISVAEKSGLINALTFEVLELAVEQLSIWREVGIDIPISVNLCVADIKNLELPEKLVSLSQAANLATGKLVLELTESAVMGELTSSLDVLNRLRMKGFSLSIDDFGTGYSSLSHLYQAPFSELKIDRSFVSPMLEDNEAMVIVKICVMLGHMLGMKIVAEGVESEEIYLALESIGCDIAQGYHIAKPMPSQQFVEWVNKFNV